MLSYSHDSKMPKIIINANECQDKKIQQPQI